MHIKLFFISKAYHDHFFQEVEITLFHLPKPTKHHLDTLEQLLSKIEKDFSLSNADLQSRASIAIKLDSILTQFIPGNHFVILLS